MNRKLSINGYRAIDITILTAILCLLEIAGRLALNAFPKELFSFSVVLPITLIALMRHDKLGVITAAVGAIVYCAVNGADINVYIIYILGNLCVGAVLLWFKYLGKGEIRSSLKLVILYVFSGYLAMNIGRGIFAAIIEGAPLISTTVRYLSTDSLTGIMAVIIILIARKQDGIFEDQLEYLIRQSDKEEQSNAK